MLSGGMSCFGKRPTDYTAFGSDLHTAGSREETHMFHIPSVFIVSGLKEEEEEEKKKHIRVGHACVVDPSV